MDAAAATGQTKPFAWGRDWRRAAPGEGALDWVRGRAMGPLTRLFTRIGGAADGDFLAIHIPCRGSFIVGVRR